MMGFNPTTGLLIYILCNRAIYNNFAVGMAFISVFLDGNLEAVRYNVNQLLVRDWRSACVSWRAVIPDSQQRVSVSHRCEGRRGQMLVA